MSTRDGLPAAAGDAAHAALTGQLRIPDFRLVRFLAEAVAELPEADQGRFLLLIAAAAVDSHAGTLGYLVATGVASESIIESVLKTGALARARRSTNEQQGDAL